MPLDAAMEVKSHINPTFPLTAFLRKRDQSLLQELFPGGSMQCRGRTGVDTMVCSPDLLFRNEATVFPLAGVMVADDSQPHSSSGIPFGQSAVSAKFGPFPQRQPASNDWQ